MEAIHHDVVISILSVLLVLIAPLLFATTRGQRLLIELKYEERYVPILLWYATAVAVCLVIAGFAHFAPCFTIEGMTIATVILLVRAKLRAPAEDAQFARYEVLRNSGMDHKTAEAQVKGEWNKTRL